MVFSRVNILNGACVSAIAFLFLSQTSSVKSAFMTEGMQSMDYPRVLAILLLVLGFFIAAAPKGKAIPSDIPILSRRTVGMSLSFILFALLFEPVGFAISAFIGSVICALIMGYRRYVVLCGVCAAGCTCIWALFTFVLKIPLPAGTLW